MYYYDLLWLKADHNRLGKPKGLRQYNEVVHGKQ